MTRYTAGFYRTDKNIDETVISASIDALRDVEMGFSPLTLLVSRTKRILLNSGADFRRQIVPKRYFIDTSSARIPLEAANGTEVVFTESDDPPIHPANLLIEFSGPEADARSWSAASWLALFRGVIPAFDPNYALVADEDQFADENFNERRLSVSRNEVPIVLHWINYFSPPWVQRIGDRNIDALSRVVASFERMPNGGVLFALTADRFRFGSESDRSTQHSAEDSISLTRLQQQYPNRGVA
jgi:hypothetical protein